MCAARAFIGGRIIFPAVVLPEKPLRAAPKLPDGFRWRPSVADGFCVNLTDLQFRRSCL